MAFRKYPRICALQKKNGIDLGTNHLSDVSCGRFVSSIAKDIKSDLKTDVINTRFISVLSDGSTDAAILEEEIVYVRYLQNNIPVTKFAGIKNPIKADAPGILKAIEDVLVSLKLSPGMSDEEYLENIYKKLLNGNFDGASVMSGYKSGVQTRLKVKQPGLIYTHCTAHRLELSMLDSIKFDKYLKIFDENINNIFRFYYQSASRRKELRDLALLFQENFKQLGRLKNIRWIASRSRALTLLETNYKVLVFDLESKSYGTSETAQKAKGYAEFLKTPNFLFYLHFFQDIVEKLRPLSLQFQRNDLLVCHVPRKIEETKAVVDVLQDVPGDAYNRLLKGISNDVNEGYMVYKEVTLKMPRGRRAPDVENTSVGFQMHFADVFEKIILAVQDYLDTRFADFAKTPLCEMVKIFDLKKWPSSFRGNQLNRMWGNKEILSLAEYYERYAFITAEEKALAVKQWPLFRSKIMQLKDPSKKDLHIFIDILSGNTDDIEGMIILLKIMMTISSSTAECERGFSCMNDEKTSLRTRLSNETLDDILRINVNGLPLDEFSPKPHVQSWINNVKGTRHVKGHATATKRKGEKNLASSKKRKV